MAKTIGLGTRPQKREGLPSADEWVKSRQLDSSVGSPLDSPDQMKRLTIDVTEELHRRIKVMCAQRGTKIADEVRQLLEQHFPAASA